jgi:hypothetical protein
MPLDPSIILSGNRPAPIEGPIDQYAKAIQLKSLLQAQQQSQQEAPLRIQAMQQGLKAGGQEIASRERQAATQAAINQSYKEAVKANAQGQPEIDSEALQKSLAASGHGEAIPGILENINKFQQSKATLTEAQQKIADHQSDLLGYAAKAVQNAKYDPRVAHTILDTLPHSPQIDAMRQQIDQNPDAFKQIVDNAISQSPAQQKNVEEEKVAAIKAQREGELPLGADKVSQLNQALTSRWQVLNPNKPLPAQFTIPTDATQKDYDRINGSLKDTENAVGTKAQRDAVNAARANQQGTNQAFTVDDPLVQAVATNKMKLTEALTPRTPIDVRRKFVDALHQANPDFDTKNYDVEKGVEKAFTSGQYSQQLNSINRAREHMGTFLDLAKNINNTDIQIVNKAKNAFKTAFGSEAPVDLNIAKQAFASEVGKSFAGSSVALADRQELDHQISGASSWDQLSGAARTADKLLAGAQKALKQTYDAGRQAKPNFGEGGADSTGGTKPHPFFESLGGQARQ